jgi:hypothetical protein
MNASDIVRLLYSNHYSPADLEEVTKLCREFPEFSTAHLLKVRILEALGHEKQQELKVAAIYSMNRTRLLQLVNEAKQVPEPETETATEEKELIQFSEESSEQADVIIEQHAPYAGPDPETDLLELDEESGEELLEILDEEKDEQAEEEQPGEEQEEDLGPDVLLSPVEKSETEMEEPESAVEEVPAMDQVDHVKEKSNNQLISQFIKDDPGPIRADKETRLKGDVSLASIREHDGLITDTLAQIYVKQGLFAKAIYAYEKLSLKYPEKSAYFAAQIEKIRNINHS